MGMFKDLTDDEVRAVAEYVKSFSFKWRKPEVQHEFTPDKA